MLDCTCISKDDRDLLKESIKELHDKSYDDLMKISKTIKKRTYEPDKAIKMDFLKEQMSKLMNLKTRIVKIEICEEL